MGSSTFYVPPVGVTRFGTVRSVMSPSWDPEAKLNNNKRPGKMEDLEDDPASFFWGSRLVFQG